MDFSFSVNQYDEDGHEFNCGIFLHFGNTILKFYDFEDLKAFHEQLGKALPEIKETNERLNPKVSLDNPKI